MPSTLRTQFLMKYNKMSKDKRNEIVLDYNGQPFTWNPIFIEVYNYTRIGQKMLLQLRDEGKLL